MKRKQLAILFTLFAISSNVINAQSSNSIKLETQSDSIGYGVGLAQSQYIINPNMEMGPEQRKMFLKGLMEAQQEGDSLQKAYYMGLVQGLQFGDDTFSEFNKQLFEEETDQYVRKEVFLAGLEDGILKKDTKIGIDTLESFLNRTVEKAQVDARAKKYTENKKASEEFLKKNKKKKGVKTLPNGLQYKVITAGKGEKPTIDDTVEVNYRGTLIDGTEFDSSYERNEPIKFGLKNVIKGWTEVLQLMPVGSKWEVYIPYDLGYGDREAGDKIKPFSTLIFEIDLLGIEDKEAAEEE